MIAIYKTNPAYPGNPFIEAIPRQLSANELLEAISRRPQMDKNARSLPVEKRLSYAAKVFEAFIPLDYAYLLYSMLFQGMQSSFVNKNAVDAVRQSLRIRETTNGSCHSDVQQYQTNAASFSILGVPGIGKSSTITRALDTIPQVIEHEKYKGKPFFCKQINYISVQCPGDCSVKAACIYILAEIDRLLGTTYALRAQAGRSHTLDAMIAQLAQLCITHHIGIIIIDEIQNIMGNVSKNGNNAKLIKFIVQLMNTTGICAVLVGTPEVGALFDAQPHLARRTRGLRISAIEYGDAFHKLLSVLWEYQCTGIYEPLSEGMKRLLYEISGGVPALLAQVLYFAQQHAITSGQERLNEGVIRETANLYQLRRPSGIRVGTPASAFAVAESLTAVVAVTDATNTSKTAPALAMAPKGRPKAYRDADDIIALFNEAANVEELKRQFEAKGWIFKRC